MKFNIPWEHYVIDDFLPNELLEDIKSIRVNSINNDKGSRTFVEERYFFTPDKSDRVTLSVVDFFKNSTSQFEEMFGYDLNDSVLRLELAKDTSEFWQERHEDTLEKRITFIIYISGAGDLGTDLYSDNDEKCHAKRVEWKENRAVIFKPSPGKWHSVDKRMYDGERRVLLAWYVDSEKWNNRNQVWDL